MSKSIKCKSCKQEISKGTSYCPHCGKKQSNFFMRHKVITIIGILIIIGIFSHYNKTRQVIGTATNLGAGTFTVGTDIKAGLYDVTPTDGSGNLIITTLCEKPTPLGVGWIAL